MKNITLTEALDALKQAVDERGETFRYTDRYPTEDYGSGCTYVVNESPACLAGAALDKLGVPLDALKALDLASGGVGSTTIASEAAERVLRSFDIEMSGQAARALRTAQAAQDYGQDWGSALNAAEQEQLAWTK